VGQVQVEQGQPAVLEELLGRQGGLAEVEVVELVEAQDVLVDRKQDVSRQEGGEDGESQDPGGPRTPPPAPVDGREGAGGAEESGDCGGREDPRSDHRKAVLELVREGHGGGDEGEGRRRQDQPGAAVNGRRPAGGEDEDRGGEGGVDRRPGRRREAVEAERQAGHGLERRHRRERHEEGRGDEVDVGEDRRGGARAAAEDRELDRGEGDDEDDRLEQQGDRDVEVRAPEEDRRHRRRRRHLRQPRRQAELAGDTAGIGTAAQASSGPARREQGRRQQDGEGPVEDDVALDVGRGVDAADGGQADRPLAEMAERHRRVEEAAEAVGEQSEHQGDGEGQRPAGRRIRFPAFKLHCDVFDPGSIVFAATRTRKRRAAVTRNPSRSCRRCPPAGCAS
jgi:hypothetical protein